jgi:O-antigen/teichoic acid export membrane protein
MAFIPDDASEEATEAEAAVLSEEVDGTSPVSPASDLKRRGFRKNAAFSVAEVVFGGLALFLIYRTVVIHLGPAQLGIWSLVLATTSFARVADIGISAGLARFIAREQGKGSEGQTSSYVQTATVTAAALFLALSLLAYYPVLAAMSHILSGADLELGQNAVPYALVSFCLVNIYAVLAAILLGLHRADRRAITGLSGMVVQFVVSLSLIDRLGIVGLAIGQATQYFAAICIAWVFIRRDVRKLPIFPWHFSSRTFREVVGLGARLQVGTIAILVYEPLSKLTLGYFAGPATLGFFELASRFLQQVRSALVLALQNLVPMFAELHDASPERTRALLNRSTGIALLLGAPAMLACAAAAPVISYLWIGRFDPTFVLIVFLLASVWVFNIFSAPTYFFWLGIGRVNANILGHVVTGVLAPTLGYLGGVTTGYAGVVIAVGVAKTVGDAFPVFAIAREQGGQTRRMVLTIFAVYAACCAGLVALWLLVEPVVVTAMQHPLG